MLKFNGNEKKSIVFNSSEKFKINFNGKWIYWKCPIYLTYNRPWNATSSNRLRYNYWTDQALPIPVKVRTYLKKNNGNTELDQTKTYLAGQKISQTANTKKNYKVGNSGTGFWIVITAVDDDTHVFGTKSVSFQQYCKGGSSQSGSNTTQGTIQW